MALSFVLALIQKRRLTRLTKPQVFPWHIWPCSGQVMQRALEHFPSHAPLQLLFVCISTGRVVFAIGLSLMLAFGQF
jgi:hypothetical protein